MKQNHGTDQVLSDLRSTGPSISKFWYLNVNSVRKSELTDFQEIINGNLDAVVSIAETKTDASFPSVHFVFDGHHLAHCLDISSKSGGILVYVKPSLPSRRLSCENLCDSIQAVPFEVNLRKEKWLVISIYRPPSQNSEYFLNNLTKMTDFFADTYDNY